MPIDVQDSLVQVALPAVPPATPTYTTIQDVDTWDGTHGTEGLDRRRVFGRAAPYVRLGDDTDTYDLSGLLNLADTNGQNIIRSARDNRTIVILRVLPSGAATGSKGYTQECYVTEYSDSGDAGGDYVEASFTLEGAAPKVDITL